MMYLKNIMKESLFFRAVWVVNLARPSKTIVQKMLMKLLAGTNTSLAIGTI